MTSNSNSVKRRAVFFVGGFDPKSPDEFYSRMDRENQRFEQLWGANVARQKLESHDDDIVRCRFETAGEDYGHAWSTRTDFNFMTLDDIVLKDFARPLRVRLWRYAKAFADYMLSGTAFKFVRHGWRFSIYFFYPALMMLASMVVSLWVGSLTGELVDSTQPIFSLVVAAIAFLALIVGCYHLILKRYHVLHLADLWSFSREFLHRRRGDMDDKLDRLADRIFQAVSGDDYDEVLTIGHSTGGALILDASARVLERHPEFADLENNLTVLTIGSTGLKIGMHPSAGWFRDRLEKLFSQTPTRWLEYQCIMDIINFYRTVPSEIMGIDKSMQHPMVTKRVQISALVEPEVYKRIKSNFFRVHYQFVFGNTRKYIYDFPAICFGPAKLMWRILYGGKSRLENPFMDNLSGIEEERK
ncbi:MAG: lipase [Rhizobiaceae bacterium]|nr:lipase [Rhizobiaceae bacterium]